MTPIGDEAPAYRIERALPADLAELPAIEREAAALFEGLPLATAALAEPTSPEELRAAQEAGLLWVARSRAGGLAGFALVELLQGQPHLEEIDVRPAHARRGVGRSLVEAVLGWARARGHRAVTLTTFREVPWNAPFYASAGFRVLAPAEITPALAAVVRDEAARGIDASLRVVMRCELDR
jgi:GNAT superfamily N-acetyltransferase